MTLLIGLTGGIASGKSTTAAYFRTLGIATLDTDKVASDLSQTDSVLNLLHQTLPPEAFQTNGQLNRAKTRAIVFQQPALKDNLEKILHPKVRDHMLNWQAQHAPKDPYAIVEVPLLLETNLHTWVKRILVVDTTQDLQKSRAQARDAMSSDTLDAIMAHQIDRAARLRAADDILHNDGTLQHLYTQIDRLDQTYRALASRRR